MPVMEVRPSTIGVPNPIVDLSLDYLHDFSRDVHNLTGDWGLIEGTTAVLGYSPLGILSFLLLSLILAILPILYSLRTLPGDMVVGACDSLVLSAACHPYISTYASSGGHSDTMNNLVNQSKFTAFSFILCSNSNRRGCERG